MKEKLTLLKDECGQGLAEYALILALVAIVVVAALRTLGTRVDSSIGSFITTWETNLPHES